MQDLIDLGKKKGWCPYFLARHSVNFANIVVFSYQVGSLALSSLFFFKKESFQYVIDPKITELVSKEFKNNSIVVFDEAHNIGLYNLFFPFHTFSDNVCIDSLSVRINKQTLEAGSRNVKKLTEIVKE